MTQGTDPAPLTDEELAAWPLDNGGYEYLPPEDLRRLLAEVKRLRAEVDELNRWIGTQSPNAINALLAHQRHTREQGYLPD